jgi:hypothetical protein
MRLTLKEMSKLLASGGNTTWEVIRSPTGRQKCKIIGKEDSVRPCYKIQIGEWKVL